MPALVAGIHVLDGATKEDVDGRVKPGHDTEYIPLTICYQPSPANASALSMALSSISSDNFLSLTARASCSAPTIIP